MRLRTLYPLNIVALMSHQVEAAWCEEWLIFGVPGGLMGFVAFNALLLAPFLVGSDRVARGADSAPHYAIFSGLVGLTTLVIHASFIASGEPHFRLPTSFAIFAVLALVSACLLLEGRRVRRAARG